MAPPKKEYLGTRRQRCWLKMALTFPKSDGREWLIGGKEPTFADITPCVAIALSKFPTNNTPLDERFEFIDKIWRRWQTRDSFKRANADGNSGLPELASLKKA